ncbi:matrixin family metalloprotease [uncultured Serinicoccus sp.]|uniref:matrixin family metalloprotease n=1 Tax=uncultured Serinicoccus sp. TaxID=735514 RepID=UPI002625AF94|nr:matrixin family metalloprotease [uncultured Serinicoccus sp.]
MFEPMARRRRAREMERRLAELDRWDELYGVGSIPTVPPRPRRRASGVGWVVVLGAVAAAVVFPTQSSALLGRVGDLVTGGGDDQPVAWADEVGAVVQEAVPLSGGPLGGLTEETSRLLPEVAVSQTGEHAFLYTQDGSEEPVGFSPCRPVEVAVNPDGAPPGYEELVEGSLARVSAASGLLLELVGESEDTFGQPRTTRDPVLITWSTASEVPALTGRTAGLGGPLVLTDAVSGRKSLVSGSVVLDREDLLGASETATVLDHELGHVLGLDHVHDPGELMSAANTGQPGFGPGDREGLARLGSIDCG